MQQVLKDYIKCCNEAWQEFSSFCKFFEADIEGSADITNYYSFDHKRFPILLSYLNALACEEGDLSYKLSKRIKIKKSKCKFDQDFLEFAKRRFSLISEVYDFHVSKESKTGMIKYGWLL